MEVSQTLHDVWLSSELVHYMYTFGGGLLPFNVILPRAKWIFRPSLAFSYIDSGQYSTINTITISIAAEVRKRLYTELLGYATRS